MKYIENTWNHAWNIISLYKRCLPLFFSINSRYNENLTTARKSTFPKLFHSFFIKHLSCTNPRQWVLKWIKYAFYFSEAHFLPKDLQANNYKQYLWALTMCWALSSGLLFILRTTIWGKYHYSPISQVGKCSSERLSNLPAVT